MLPHLVRIINLKMLNIGLLLLGFFAEVFDQIKIFIIGHILIRLETSAFCIVFDNIAHGNPSVMLYFSNPVMLP